MGLIPMKALDIPVHIVGCGAIGSFTALALAKMGITDITVYDHDRVSIENMSNQFFRLRDIDMLKANALHDLVKDFTGISVSTHARKFAETDAHNMSGIVIAAVDDMEVRKDIRDAIVSHSKEVELLIDPRMGAEVYLQYALHPRAKWYDACLYSNEAAVQEPCTANSTVYTATLAAGLIVKTVKNFITNGAYPKSVSWDIKSSSNPMLMFPNKGEDSERGTGKEN